jgi:hypothetical protein
MGDLWLVISTSRLSIQRNFYQYQLRSSGCQTGFYGYFVFVELDAIDRGVPG